LKVVALGSKAFVTGFALAGVQGEYVTSPDEASARLKALLKDSDIGLIMMSDDVSKPIQDEITAIRAKRPVPLIYEVPAPGSKKQTTEYRTLLKQILGV
jgi:V/A-type H+-transporting ATPase subunit F